MPRKVVIKKYPNRRLYDTESSAYVALDHVAGLIKSGSQVEVVDAKTGEDVTAFILTQIIVEEARNKHILLPVPLLHLAIRYGDNVLTEFFDKYLETALENYLSFKAALDEQFKAWLGMSKDFSGFAPKTPPAFKFWDSFFDLSSSSDKKPEKKTPEKD